MLFTLSLSASLDFWGLQFSSFWGLVVAFMSCLVPLRSSKSLRGSDVLEGLPCVVCDVTMHGLSNGVKVSRLCHLTRVVRSEKAMATHSSPLAWRIPWTEEPGGLQSMGSLRVGHDWATSLSLFTFMHWRRQWQPTPVFFPGESQGRWSLVDCRLWGRTESDTTEVT